MVNLEKAAQEEAQKVYKKYLKKLEQEIKAGLTSPAVVDILFGMVMQRMSSLPILSIDPTDPEKWEPQVRAEIEKNLTIAKSTVRVSDSVSLKITLLSDEFIGIDTGGPTSNEDPTPMRWLYYFIHGDLERNLYWLPASAAKELGGSYLGRFEQGYLIGKERAEAINKKLKSNVAIPQPSGEPKVDLFQSILSEEFIKRILIDPAITKAMVGI